MEDVLDVLIVGAGLSGIGMACDLKRACPGKRFAIRERRAAIGGTGDRFRYPVIRSDHDRDTRLLLEEAIADGVLSFSPGPAAQVPVAAALAA